MIHSSKEVWALNDGITTESMIVLFVVSVLILLVSTSLTPRGRSWAVGRLNVSAITDLLCILFRD